MGRKAAGRTKGSGTVYLDGKLYRAKWVVDGKTYTRATGEKDKRAALSKLAEFVRPYQAKNDVARMEGAIAQLASKKSEIKRWEDSQPALLITAVWSAYMESQSRPRSGARTLASYEQEYLDFCSWLDVNYPEIKELRNVSPDIGREYAQNLLNGTSLEVSEVVKSAKIVVNHYCKVNNLNRMPENRSDATKYIKAREVLSKFPWKPSSDVFSCGAEVEPFEVQKARYFASISVHRPVRGTTFNRHLNTLALIWRTIAADMPERAKLGENPFAWDKETGRGIRRIVLKHSERPHKRQDLTLDEIAKLLKVAKGELRLLIGLGFYTGLRLGDCVLLDWGKIDRASELIITRSAKTDIETTTYIHPALKQIISEECTSSMGYLMPELANLYASGGTGRSEVSRRITQLFKSVGIQTSHKSTDGRRARPDKTFHSLRHAYVTQLERVGVALRERQALAGHGSESMTAYYTHQNGAGVLALPNLVSDINVSNGEASSLIEQGECKTECMNPLEAFKAAFNDLSKADREEAIKWMMKNQVDASESR